MRQVTKSVALVLAVLATGCDVIFPLEGPDEEGPPDDSKPARLSIEPRNATAFAGKPTMFTLGATGEDNAQVFVDVRVDTGTLLSPPRSMTLVNGLATTTIQWTAPDELAFATVTVDGGYTPDAFDTQATGEIAVHKQFGISDLSTGVATGANTLTAFPVTIGPTRGRILELGLELVNISNASQVMIGVYMDGGGEPGAIVVGSDPISLTQSAPGASQPVDIVIEPGTYWLAFITDGAATMCGASTGGASITAALPGLFLPDAFPTSTASPATWCVSALVAPER